MDEYRICAACELELPIYEFWGDNSNEGGKNRRCKTCVKTKNLIPLENRLSKITDESRKALLKAEYDTVYSFLEAIGYRLDQDIHQQFLDRHNPKLKVPMTYQKKRKSDMPAFFPDGTYNPQYKYRYRLLDDL